MGIPRFYRWLKNRFPLIRLDLSDNGKQLPIIDNFYIDFNALVYQCIRESNCFLRNKIKPLTFQQIYQRVFDYLLGLIQTVNPKDVVYIALDGVAPRAKINQSRDRRFKGSKDDQDFQKTLVQIGVDNHQNFLQNSISPGTQFLNDLCNNLKVRTLKQLSSNWKHLKILFSDCCVPGQGEHKIMDFFRYSKLNKIFSQNTTYCVYSPDADVILLTLSLGIQNICLIKQDTSVQQTQNWTATTVYRKSEPKQFQFVMINILREYFEKQFDQILKAIKGTTIQQIIDDLILLMAFVGNDFLPVEFCFTLKDNHIQKLFYSYKTYLMQNKQFINNRGKICWQKVYKLLQIAKKFQAQMIEEMINKKKQNKNQNYVLEVENKQNNQNGDEEDDGVDIQNFQVQDQKITKGRDKYYETRFGIKDINTDAKFNLIIQAYIQGLQFYCEYYFMGLPSWNWYYPYHYTPMLTDVYEYLQKNKVQFNFPKSQPFEPFLALMFMVSLKSVELLPKPLQNAIRDKQCELRSPLDYFPTSFKLDKFQTLKYNKRALIDFLQESKVRRVYNSIPSNCYSRQELSQNSLHPLQVLHMNPISCLVQSTPLIMSRQSTQTAILLKKLFTPQNKIRSLITKQRFPSLSLWGKDFQLQDGKIVTKNKYTYGGNPGQVVFFNHFQGVIDDLDNTNQDMKKIIQAEYARIGIMGKCQFYFTIKRLHYVRQINRFCLMPSKKQVIVPDFAAFKVPNYEYIRKTQMSPSEDHYSKGEIVSILTSKYFGYQGVIQKIQAKTCQVRLIKSAVHTEEKIEDLDEDFFTVDFVLDHLNIKYETLIAIIDEIVILPQFKKKQPQSELMPTGVDFSLKFINISSRLLVPKFVRCQMEFENTKKPGQIFKNMEISKTGLELLQDYVNKFDWLIQFLEDSIQKRQFNFRKQIYARIVFSSYQNPNIQMYRQFVKLYQFRNQGQFSSIYSKVAKSISQFKHVPLPTQTLISVKHNQIISSCQSQISPPALKYQPQYHNIGDKIILLKNLQSGYVVAIDDNVIHVRVGLQQKAHRVRFHQLFNQNWTGFLAIEEGKTWNLESSYFTPNYWKKAITINYINQDNGDIVEQPEADIQ